MDKKILCRGCNQHKPETSITGTTSSGRPLCSTCNDKIKRLSSASGRKKTADHHRTASRVLRDSVDKYMTAIDMKSRKGE